MAKETNIIYLYESQLQEIISRDQDMTKGVAFEWKGERVFHIHTRFPEVAPSGYPGIAFFKIEKEQSAFANAGKSFPRLSQSFQPRENDSLAVIGVFLYLEEGCLRHNAWLRRENRVEACDVKFVPDKSELYSRSKGLLEAGILEQKKVLIVGMGSFGSHIAVELAKAGLGHFSLVDFDRIELSNISRHICGVNELGRYKTLAVRDAILVKNPYAKITTWEMDINMERSQLQNLIRDADLVICATDNNRSRFNINELAYNSNTTVIFGRAITRAEGGDVFTLKGKSSPCYSCLVGGSEGFQLGGEEEITTVRQADQVLPAYTSPEEKNAAIQVGLSSDILPICNLMVKLALVELSAGTAGGMAALQNELTYNYYFWANRREQHYLNYQPFNQARMQPTILKWFGANIPADPNCLLCSNPASR